MSLLSRTLRLGCFLSLFLAEVAFLSGHGKADVIEVDRTGVPPAYADAFINAEAFWESRIQNYSTDVPQVLLVQLTKLRILATIEPIDGPGGILGQAGPDAFITYENGELFPAQKDLRATWAMPVLSTMTFDIDDVDLLIADGIFEDVIVHEMAHALGFGSLWEQNRLIRPLGGVGLVQYTNGRHAIQQYRQELGNPVAQFVPLEQRGGPGTALGHWPDVAPFFNAFLRTEDQEFTKELMTGFAGDLDPDTGLVVFPEKFVSETTWGAMADLGWEVAGINDNQTDPQPPTGTGRWPKVLGNGDPFANNGVPPAHGVNFRISKIRLRIVRSLKDANGGNKGVGSSDRNDPYRLRNQRWVK
jgi:hypothetical protein